MRLFTRGRQTFHKSCLCAYFLLQIAYVPQLKVDLISSKRTWPLHGTTMARRLVIGARWLGREQTYVDYFDGYLSGLSVNFGERIDEKVCG